MRKLYYILLLLALTACTPKQVNFFDVPIEGSIDGFLTEIENTQTITIKQESLNIEYFEAASGLCNFLGMDMEFVLVADPVTNEYGDPSSNVRYLSLKGVGYKQPIAEFDKQYGKHKVEGLGTYWDFTNGEIGMGILGDTLLINFIRYND
jgi:hypothetical protein